MCANLVMNKDRRREKGEESRKTIIEAAIHCIATRGLCDTTLDHIAIDAKVSRALVVFHFKSKNGMLASVLEQISAQYNQDWQKIQNNKELSAQALLLKLIAYDVRLPLEKPELISVWHAFWGETKGLYKELNSARDKKYDQDTLKLIEQIAQQGDYANVKPEIINTTLAALLLGLWWNAHLNPSKYNFDQNMDVVNHYLHLNFPQDF